MTSLTSCTATRFRPLPPAAILLCSYVGISGCGPRDRTDDARHIVRVAVAANFAAAHAELVSRFEATSGIEVETSLGSTGQLYAQVVNGAPYDVFLAADVARPERLERNGLVEPRSRFTYAVGRLVLYVPDGQSTDSPEAWLRVESFQHLAVANPAIAPYGAAAQQVLERWDLWDELQARVVKGESVGQAFQFVESGAAEAGFVALSQVIDKEASTYWIVPREIHQPLLQDAVLLRTGALNAAAGEFLEFLRSEEAQQVLASYGYELP
jgi:molybdate transport system substrate-binding protein